MAPSAKKGAKPTRPRRARGSINPADIVTGAFEFFFVGFYTLLAADDLKCDLIVRQIGAPHDGAPHDGAPHDGAPHDGAPQDGALNGSWPRADELFAALAADGMPPSVVQHAFFTLSVYTQGFLLVGRTGRGTEPLSSAAPGRPQETPGEFEFGITSIIRGLRPLVAASDHADAVA